MTAQICSILLTLCPSARVRRLHTRKKTAMESQGTCNLRLVVTLCHNIGSISMDTLESSLAERKIDKILLHPAELAMKQPGQYACYSIYVFSLLHTQIL